MTRLAPGVGQPTHRHLTQWAIWLALALGGPTTLVDCGGDSSSDSGSGNAAGTEAQSGGDGGSSSGGDSASSSGGDGGSSSGADGGSATGGSSDSAGNGGATGGDAGSAGQAGGAAIGGAGGAAGAPTCIALSPDNYGICDASLGWAFDGTLCNHFSGCGCASDCGHFFSTAAQCALACRAEQHCNPAALQSGGIAGDFVEGAFCDDIRVCADRDPYVRRSDLDAVLDVSGTCGSDYLTACDTESTCRAVESGYADGELWDSICAASLLRGVELTCMVYGP